MIKKIYLIFGLILISLAFISAETNDCGSQNSFLGTFKQNTNISLIQTCDTCTFVKLDSVKSASGTITNMALVNMTKNGNTFSYTYYAMEIGCYSYNVCGDKGGSYLCEVIDFKVTPNGFTDSIGFYVLILILTIGIIIFGYYAEDYWVVILGAFGMVLFGLYILFYGLAGMKDTVYTWGIGIIILMLGAYFGTRAGIEQLS
jgi:hypothetical protein